VISANVPDQWPDETGPGVYHGRTGRVRASSAFRFPPVTRLGKPPTAARSRTGRLHQPFDHSSGVRKAGSVGEGRS
jgi:hypothetical protein